MTAHGWMPWRGSICSVDPLSVVEYRLRLKRSGDTPLVSTAGNLRWDHGRSPESAADANLSRNVIVVYRIKKDDSDGN